MEILQPAELELALLSLDKLIAEDHTANKSWQLALEQGCNPYPEGGYRLVSNTGREGGQEVQHLHFHVMGGPRPWLRG